MRKFEFVHFALAAILVWFAVRTVRPCNAMIDGPANDKMCRAPTSGFQVRKRQNVVDCHAVFRQLKKLHCLQVTLLLQLLENL